MKRCAAALVSLSLFGGSVYAERAEQSAELWNLINKVEQKGYAVDYEKSAATVFDEFIDIETKDSADSSLTTAQRNYNSKSMDRIYSETKSNLEGYLSGDKSAWGAIDFPKDGTRKISGNVFTDSTGAPLQSVGFGHFSDIFTDSDILKTIGSNNIQTELGPSSVTQPTSATLWKVLKNNGCDADISVVTEDGNNMLRIVNRVDSVENTYVLISQWVPVAPNTSYVISIDAKASTSTQILVLPDGWDRDEARYKTIAAADDFSTYKMGGTFRTGADRYYTNFMIIFEKAATLDLDNITLKKLGSSDNLIKNADFDKTGNYYFETSNIESKINDINTMAEKGYSVDLLLSPHYMPEFMLTNYPDMKMSSSGTFLGYNVNYPMARQFIGDYVDFVTSMIRGCNGIQSICLSNEPNFYCSQAYDYYNPIFKTWLEEKYGTIANLNTTYGKSYSSFSAVNIPTAIKGGIGSPKCDPVYYDYILFNEEQFTDWHKMLAENVKKNLPNMPVHAKMQDYLFLDDAYSPAKMMTGTDIESFAEFSDITGNDACTYVSTPDSHMGVMMWYDFISSLTEKPVYNSEDHVITDGNTDYSDAQAQNVRFSLLSGAIHGRSASTLWLWGTPTGSIPKGLFKSMPYATYLTGKTMLDMTRLNRQINAFQTADKDTAIFYSKPSRVLMNSGWTNTYEEALRADYNALAALGHKIGFVTEKSAKKVYDYKTLVLTDVRYISEESVSVIADFMRKGGNVIVDGSCSNVLKYTDYGVSASSDDRTYIKNNATYVTSRTAAAFDNAYIACGENGSFVKENGSVAAGIDLKTAKYGNEKLVYVTNMTSSAKTVTFDGKYKDLLSGNIYDGTAVLQSYEPLLLTDKLVDYNIEITEKEISEDGTMFKSVFIPDSDGVFKTVVLLKDSGGNVVGGAYKRTKTKANTENVFYGTLDGKNVNSAIVSVFDADNGVKLAEATLETIGENQ